MYRTTVAAPVAALAIVTAACGLAGPGTVTPSISPGGGPRLTRVWHLSAKVADPYLPKVVGDVVVAKAPGEGPGSVFIDGATGRVVARPGYAFYENSPTRATDERGRPVVAANIARLDSHKAMVSDTSGHLVWRSRSNVGRYAGGYTMEPEKAGRAYRAVIRTASGRAVARLPLDPSYYPTSAVASLDLVRPGLLVVGGYGEDYRQVALIDVSLPDRARILPLRHTSALVPPPEDYTTYTAVTGGHVYVAWEPNMGPITIARYDAPDTHPLWHRPAPAGFPGLYAFEAHPGPRHDALSIVGHDNGNKGSTWFLRPDTGAPIIAPKDWNGTLVTVTGGRAYLDHVAADVHTTRVLDLRTGKWRTITYGEEPIAGVTSNGYLIFTDGTTGITAYRWS